MMAAWAAFAPLAAAAVSDEPPLTVELIGTLTVEATAVEGAGGFSGIDYDAAHDDWVVISDARDAMRMFRLQVDYDARGVRSARVTPGLRATLPDGARADAESIRLGPTDGRLWIANEGDAEATPLVEPGVFTVAPEGGDYRSVALPTELSYTGAGDLRLEGNRAIEGLSFSPDGEAVWLATEAAFLDRPEDGARIYRRSVAGGDWQGRRYDPDAVPDALATLGRPAVGVSELLATGEGDALVLERAGAEAAPGHWVFGARLYAVDWDDLGAKRLVYDFAAAGVEVDNLEGLAWGRPLPDGRPTLLVLSDDNFSAFQQTQLWVFAVNGRRARLGWNTTFAGVRHDEAVVSGFVGEYAWLSNYYPCPVTYEGRSYLSSEAAYHASKFPEEQRDAFTTLGADESKKLSRRLTVDPAWWDARKRRVMREIMVAKFSQNPDLGQKLQATGDRELIELNWWNDQYWGVFQGQGDNVLGQVLMDVRAELAGR